jgi:hypothetical protein
MRIVVADKSNSPLYARVMEFINPDVPRGACNICGRDAKNGHGGFNIQTSEWHIKVDFCESCRKGFDSSPRAVEWLADVERNLPHFRRVNNLKGKRGVW